METIYDLFVAMGNDDVTDDSTADRIIEYIKKQEQEKKRFEDMARERKEKIDELLEIRLKPIQKILDRLNSNLQVYFKSNLMDKAKDSKTKKKYELLNGTIIYKKPAQKLTTKSFDDKELIAYLEKHDMNSFVKEKISYKPDWSGVKDRFKIANNKVVDTCSGEVIDFMEIIYKVEEFEIKWHQKKRCPKKTIYLN